MFNNIWGLLELVLKDEEQFAPYPSVQKWITEMSLVQEIK